MLHFLCSTNVQITNKHYFNEQLAYLPVSSEALSDGDAHSLIDFYSFFWCTADNYLTRYNL